MRSKDVLLNDFDDVKILMQYLYMSEEHTVVFSNGLTELSISMTDDFHFLCQNLNFPDIPPMRFDDQMNLPYILGIIDVLKDTKAIEFPDRFSNRWDELKTLTMANLALNMTN